ncbi:MAG: HD domain-containing protein, partial [Gemmatimonadetes bacterium]|nr:HD domain-containing protein [Gemmatimonadota bacterium]
MLADRGELIDRALVERAFRFGAEAHRGQKRLSGEDFISHSVAVAEILLHQHLDTTSVVAALLHDVVEDSDVSIEEVEEEAGLLYYSGGELRVREDEVSDITNFSLPQERLMKGKVDSSEVFELRYSTLLAQVKSRQSPVRGFLGGRVDLIPHQMYILHEVAMRQIPRVLLADEVGLGKTI